MNSSESSPGPFRKALLALSPNCKEASRLQSEAMHRPIPFPQRMGLRIHLLLCNWCRRYGKNIRFLKEVAEDSQGEEPCNHTHALTPDAKERMKQKLTNHSKDEPSNKHD
jgi:hypothetical protein